MQGQPRGQQATPAMLPASGQADHHPAPMRWASFAAVAGALAEAFTRAGEARGEIWLPGSLCTGCCAA